MDLIDPKPRVPEPADAPPDEIQLDDEWQEWTDRPQPKNTPAADGIDQEYLAI
jgi:hypothetical protein